MTDFAIIGFAVFLGLLGGKIFDKMGVPEVIGVVLIGILMGESVLGILTTEKLDYYKPLIDLALAFFGFFIGSELKIRELKEISISIISILFFEVIFTFIIVTSGLYLLTRELVIPLILGTLAISTAPAATADVIWEYRASGKLTTTILAIVGFDDVATVFVYSIISNYLLNYLTGRGFSIISAFSYFLWHIGFAFAIGFSFSLILTLLTKLFRKERDVLIVGLGLLILASGLAEVIDASEIISTMILGIFFSNMCSKAETPISTLRELSAPIFTIFFVLIGARLDIHLLPALGSIGIAYLIFSITGKSIGATVGAVVSKAEKEITRNIGISLYSQAGIALGLGTHLYYDLKEIGIIGFDIGMKIMNILISATFILLIIGPIMVKYALKRANEIKES